jgi:hypothetical protein
MLKRASACVFAMLAVIASSAARAQDVFDRRALFTFSQPVTLPGITLPAGTYMFRLATPETDRNIVQITSPDRSVVYATVFARRVQREQPSDAPDVRLVETASHLPAAVDAWWYSGDRWGWEFVYPREQAMRIAEARLRRPSVAPTPTVADHGNR